MQSFLGSLMIIFVLLIPFTGFFLTYKQIAQIIKIRKLELKRKKLEFELEQQNKIELLTEKEKENSEIIT